MLELKLLNESDKAQLLEVLRARKDRRDYELNEESLESESLAEKVLAGLRFLKEHDLVIVESSSMTDYDPTIRVREDWGNDSRTGVMSTSDFFKLYGNGPLKASNWTRRISHNVDGKDILIDGNYADLLDYLEFAHRYNADTKRWEPKSDRWESKESAIYRQTEALLKEITDSDPLYLHAPLARKFVLKNFNDIAKGIYDSNLRVQSIPLALQTVIDDFNVIVLKNLVEQNDAAKSGKYPQEITDTIYRLLPKGSNAKEYQNFLTQESGNLHLVHGHFCLRDYLKRKMRK